MEQTSLNKHSRHSNAITFRNTGQLGYITELDSPFSFKINIVFLQLLIGLSSYFRFFFLFFFLLPQSQIRQLTSTHMKQIMLMRTYKSSKTCSNPLPGQSLLYCATASRNTLSPRRFCFLDLPVIYKVSILPWGPLWPCLCLLHVLGRSSLFSDDVSHCQG